LSEYLERNKEKHENKVFYSNNENQQAQYIKMFKEHDLEAIILSSTIDSHFIQFLESQESSIKFNRIDSDLSETMKETKSENQTKEEEEAQKQTNEALEKIFKTALNNDKLKIQVEALKMESTPAVILLSEQSRRMQEMSMMFGGGIDMKSMFPDEQTLVLNKNNNLVQAILKLNGDSNSTDDINMFCEQIYDLAMMSHKPLEPETMSKFIERSTKIMSKLV
jgi:molecular chaperone HtpG